MRKARLIAAVLLAAASRVGAQAQDKWEFTIAPYLLVPTMQGTTTLGRLPPVSVNASPSDVFSHLQSGFMIYAEAQKGKIAIVTDYLFMTLKQDVNQDGNWATGSLTFKQSAWETFALVRVAKPLELGGGVSANNITPTLTANILPIDTSVTKRQSLTWWLPVLDARWTPVSGKKWKAFLFGEYGFTNGNNWVYQVMPSVNYRFSNLFEMALQYRWIGLNYVATVNSAPFHYQMNIFGPQLGFGFHF